MMFDDFKMLSRINTVLRTLLLVIVICISCYGRTFHFGVAGPWEGFYAAGSHGAGALHIVVDRILQDNITFYEINRAGHVFKYAWTDTECNPSAGIPKVADLLYGLGPLQTPVDVLFGAVCSVVCEPIGYFARDMNIPMISFGCYSNLLSDKSIYPTHARTTGPFEFSSPVFMALVNYFHYTRVSIFTGAESFHSAISEIIREELTDDGVLVTDFVTLPGLSSGDKSKSLKELSVIKNRCKGKYNMFDIL